MTYCTVYQSTLLFVSGAALKHVVEKVFISDSGMRRTVPKVLVVVTDGRSQDDVKKSASKLQQSGKCTDVLPTLYNLPGEIYIFRTE